MGNGKVLTVVLLLTTLSGCIPFTSRLGLPQTAAEIQTRHEGKTVRLSGTVVQQAPFLEGGAYALEDRSGTVWVLTEAALPELETELTVEGVVQSEKVVLGDRATQKQTEKTVYIQEIDRK